MKRRSPFLRFDVWHFIVSLFCLYLVSHFFGLAAMLLLAPLGDSLRLGNSFAWVVLALATLASVYLLRELYRQIRFFLAERRERKMHPRLHAR